MKQSLPGLPVLYMSRYINRHKADYCRLLPVTRDTGDRELWLLFLLDGVGLTSRQTTMLIQGIRVLMQSHKHRLREELPQDRQPNHIFSHPSPHQAAHDPSLLQETNRRMPLVVHVSMSRMGTLT